MSPSLQEGCFYHRCMMEKSEGETRSLGRGLLIVLKAQ